MSGIFFRSLVVPSLEVWHSDDMQSSTIIEGANAS